MYARLWKALCLPANSVVAMMSFATSSVSVPSTASMSPPIVAVFVSFAEPPQRLQFSRPLERFLPDHVTAILTGARADGTIRIWLRL